MLSVVAQAQGDEMPLSARVVNESNMPLEGVMVEDLNSSRVTFTGLDGRFILQTEKDADLIVLTKSGYQQSEISVRGFGLEEDNKIVLRKLNLIDGKNTIALPYNDFIGNRVVSAVSTITGEELTTFPTANLMEALSGRVPGLVVSSNNSIPGEESVSISVRGTIADIYVDGIMRDPRDLIANDVDKIFILKDISARAVLGLSGANPVIWIITKKGYGINRFSVSTEVGIATPTILPEYLDAYNYSLLYNEALNNDGYNPRYTQVELNTFKNNSDPLNYPNIDYYDRFVKKSALYKSAVFSSSGSNRNMKYYTSLSYIGNEGLEAVGQRIVSDRFRFRGNLEYQINDWIWLNANISGAVQQQTYPNIGGGAGIFNIFDQVLSVYPSNAHPLIYNDTLVTSSDYPINLQNELQHSGYAEKTKLSSQNDLSLVADLSKLINGLRFVGNASFNTLNTIGIGKGGTEELYRINGGSLQRVQEKVVQPDMTLGMQSQVSSISGSAKLSYNRKIGLNDLSVDGIFFRAVIEEAGAYQPTKLADLSFRINYAYDERYVAQFDIVATGSMLLPPGQRISWYPSFGLGWIVSNESFLRNSSLFNYLKVFSSLGTIGIDDFSIPGFNQYFLTETFWRTGGSWATGIPGSTGSANVISIAQTGNPDIRLPIRSFFNLGFQSRLVRDKISLEMNYFREKNTSLFSLTEGNAPDILGGRDFMMVRNHDANLKWGFDGMAQFNGSAGSFTYSIGGNILYIRGKHLTVSEPDGLPEYRKLSGKDMDLIWSYRAEGLFQTEDEIDNNNILYSWGVVKPGDIKYSDYNDDGIINEFDIHATGNHSPRKFYGVNFTLNFKGLSIMLHGEGTADGQVQLLSNRYFLINNPLQNYSKLMLDRWPQTNSYPRLSTKSDHNIQSSTFWSAEASYFRIKNLALSYALPMFSEKQGKTKEFNVFIKGTNLLTFSNLARKYSLDPEDINAGIRSYPLYRTVVSGISVKF
jgi:TonB-linked SusC/RagA family outer membrane protein